MDRRTIKLFEPLWRPVAFEIRKTKVTAPEAIREIGRIPTYLELATKGGADRFSKEEIAKITDAFSYYKTTMDRTDVVKELLSIGEKDGRLLSTDEIVNMLEISSDLPPNEQKNIFGFLKRLKEDSSSRKTLYGPTNEPVDTSLLFSINKNLTLIRVGVAKCDNPGFLLKLWKADSLTVSALPSIANLEKLSRKNNGNMDIVYDLANAFTPKEVADIIDVIFKKGIDVSNYKRVIDNSLTRYEFFTERDRILHRLGIENDINKSFGSDVHRIFGDQFPESLPHFRFYDGNYGGGKRR